MIDRVLSRAVRFVAISALLVVAGCHRPESPSAPTLPPAPQGTAATVTLGPIIHDTIAHAFDAPAYSQYDDFVSPVEAELRQIRVRGFSCPVLAWEGVSLRVLSPVVIQPTAFTISFFADDGKARNLPKLPTLWSRTIPADNSLRESVGRNYARCIPGSGAPSAPGVAEDIYTIPLPSGFAVNAGVRYWISIEPVIDWSPYTDGRQTYPGGHWLLSSSSGDNQRSLIGTGDDFIVMDHDMAIALR